VSLGDQQGKAVEYEIDGTRGTRRREESPHGAADLQEGGPFTGLLGEHERRAPGGQVSLPRELQVERFELARGVQ
jgi:hypothetical protein